MSYKVAVRRDGQEDTPIKWEPKELTIEEHYEGGLCVEATYYEGKLAMYDPEGYQAIKYAWPGEDVLVLLKENAEDGWDEVFAGTVTKVGDGAGELCIAAHEAAGPEPDPLALTVSQDTTDPNRLSVSVVADNHGAGEVSLSFGDGTATVSNPGDGTTLSGHAYAAGGTFTVVATDVDQPERTASQVVTVPYPFGDLEVQVNADPADTTRRTASVTANNQGAGQVAIDFGDGTTAVSNPGDGTTVSTHAFTLDGSYTLTVTDVDQPERTLAQTVVIPIPAA